MTGKHHKLTARPRTVELRKRITGKNGFTSPVERGIPVSPRAPAIVHDLFHIIDNVHELSYSSIEVMAGYSEGLLSRARKNRATMKVNTLVDVLAVMGYELQIVNKDTGNVVQKPQSQDS